MELFSIYAVGLADLAKHAAGVADGDDPSGDIARDHAARADDGARAYGHAGQYRDVAAYPDVVADDDGRALFKPGVALGGKQGMDGCVHTAAGTDKAVRTEAYRRAVHEIRAVIYKAVVADVAVEAVIDNEGCEYADIPAHVRHQFAQYALALSGIRRRREAELTAQLLCLSAYLAELHVIVRVVPQALFHLFTFGQLNSPSQNTKCKEILAHLFQIAKRLRRKGQK